VHVTEDSLVQCAGDIRRALGPDRDALKTLPGRGYRLETAARAAGAPAARPRPAFTRLALATGLAAIALAAASLAMRPPPAEPARLAAEGPVVAVLPFENLAPDPRWDRLARGVTQEVIADLATNPWLSVLADATTRPHAGATPQAVADALGARHVVTGALQADDGRVRVSATLTDPGSGRQVWSRQWEGPADDLLVLQTTAAEALAGELAGHYSGAIAMADRARAHEADTRDLDAYGLYLLGIEHKHRMTPRDFELAEDYLLRAVAIDPDFAKAWVGLSIVMNLMVNGATDEQQVAEFTRRLRDYVARAIAADPDDPSALLQAGWVAGLDGDYEAAGRAIRRAVERAPNDADVLAVAAWSSPAAAGIAEEANAWADRALALNPAVPGWYQIAKGTAAFGARDYAAAVAALQAAPPDYAERTFLLAAAQAMRGETEAARAAADELRALLPGFDLDSYAAFWPEPDFNRRLRSAASAAGLD
jgi:TolB-like protein